MSTVVNGEGPDGPAPQEVDNDRVDFSWLTAGLRRFGLVRPPRQPPLPPPSPAEQLALFGPSVVLRRRPTWRRATGSGDSVADSLPSKAAADPLARVVLAAAVLLYIVLFLRWTFRQFDGLGQQAFDLGIFDQGVWLLSRFKKPFVTINGRNLFGDHTSFILLPWAVVYRLIPSAKVLLTGQTLALGLGAWPAFLIAREKLRDEMLAALLAVTYLLHPVLGWANLSEGFHPDAFEIPLVLLAFWFLLEHRWVGYGVCVVALLLVKEDVALLTFALGVYVALRHDRRVGWITCGVSAAYLVAAFWMVIPAFLGAGTVYKGRIPFGGPTGFVKMSFSHPGDVFAYLVTEKRGWYLWQLFAPIGFVAWWAPSVMLIAIGPLLFNLISDFGYQYDVRYHYSTLILPVVVIATIFGVAAAPRPRQRLIVGVLFAASLWCAYLWSPTPIGRVHPFIANPDTAQVASFYQAVRLLPPDAIVSAYYGYVPSIAHREEIYMFPNPWRASYWGTFKQEGQRLPRADRVQYILVPNTISAEDMATLDSLRGEFTVVFDQDGVELFERRP